MGIILNQSIKGAIGNYVGVLLGALNILIIFPKVLDPDQIGLMRVLQDISILIASLSQFGLANIIDKFFPYFNVDKIKQGGFFLFIILYAFLGFTLICCLLWGFQNIWVGYYSAKSPLLVNYFLITIPLALFVLFQQILEAYLRANLQIVFPLYIREIYLRIALAFFTFLYAFEWISFESLVYCLILGYAFAVFMLLYYMVKLKYFRVALFEIQANTVILKDMIFYGLIVFLTGFVGVLSSRIDIVMLSSISLETTGIYSIAFFMGTVIEIPRRSLSQISIPIISNGWKNNDISLIEAIYKKTSIVQTIIGGLLFILLIINLKDVFNLIPNSSIYISGLMVVVIIGLSKLVDMVSGVNAEIILSSPFYRINLYMSVFFGISNVLFNVLLIPEYGMNGAALGTLISLVLVNLFRFWVIWRNIHITPFSVQTIKILGVGIVLIGVNYWIDIVGNTLWKSVLIIMIKSVIATVLFIYICFKLKASEEINQFILSRLKKIKIN